MKEYIERECALAYIEDSDPDVLDFDGEERLLWGFSRSKAIEIICSVPTADVGPIKHGKWVKVSEYMPIYVCSICEERNLFRNGDNVLSLYCPKCGAKMENGE